MSKSRRPDDPGLPGSAEGTSASAPDALTSDDIFGEILDEVGGQKLGAAAAAASRPADGRRPIKVQVSEPGAGTPARDRPRAARPGGPKELLPEDVATLLDAFEGPAGTELLDMEPQPAGEPEHVDDPEPLDEPDAFEPEPEPLHADLLEELTLDPADEPAVIDALDDDDPGLSLVLDSSGDEAVVGAEPPAHAAAPPAAASAYMDAEADDEELPPPPPPARDPDEFGTDEGLRDLMNLMRHQKARTHKMGAGPNKFTVAEATPPGATPSLDLALLAERALEEGSPAAAAARSTAPSAVVQYGPYRLLQRIAVGGMAEVFRAKRAGVEGFEKVVAVKRILPHLSDNKEFVDMFVDEAKMVASLTHPSIVQIFDLGRIDKTYFIAMEYVHGRDLRSILRRAREKGMRMPLDLAVLVASRVCSALEFAHRKKDERGRPMLIVHRDVSPQNILISFEGEVKLTDFGIAKAATKASITDAGALRGKLLYMSPEQAWGKPMDRRSDIFSLGIVFYEMCTDQKPFRGSSEMSVLEMVRECRVAPPSEINPRIPERLERALLRSLARDPDDRYQDAAEMYKDLERVLHERQPPTTAELARFMEVLFDETERSEADDPAAAVAAQREGEPSDELHVEFEGASAAATAPEPVAAPSPVRDPMSIQKLLKRFGIK